MMRRFKTRDGFTLIEVMVAALLLLIVMAGFLPVFLQGLNQSTMVRYKSQATNIAQERMEEIRQLDYREIDETSLHARFAARDLTETVRNEVFTVDYSVATVTYETGNLKEVTVRVWWTAPPAVSEAKITTLVHSQFVGPRGSLLEFVNPSPVDDPADTPFGLLGPTETIRYHIAEADWPLVYDNLNQPGETPKDVYMLMQFVNDTGSTVYIGPGSGDKKIGKSYIVRTPLTGIPITDICFEYPFSTNEITDGYWEARAVAYNQYGEPGNMWRLRVRVENRAPYVVTALRAQGQANNQSVVITWTAGKEGDRKRWVVERQKKDPVTGWPAADSWVTLPNNLLPTESTFTDPGSVADHTDPWSDGITPNYYRYRVYAVDIAEKVGDIAPFVETQLPPPAVPIPTKYIVTSSKNDPIAGDAVTISAQLADADGNPVAIEGKVVTWTKSGTGGSFASATSTTSANGTATVVFVTPTVVPTATMVTATDGDLLTGISLGITTAASGVHAVKVQNKTTQTYAIVIKDSAGNPVWTGTLAAGSSANPTVVTASELVANAYGQTDFSVVATSGSSVPTASFKVPRDDGTIVLIIL